MLSFPNNLRPEIWRTKKALVLAIQKTAYRGIYKKLYAMKPTESHSDSSLTDDDDDDAPEDIPIASSRSIALEQSEKEKLAAKTVIHERKRKAREKQEKHEIDNKAKVSRPLERIPDEILNLVPDYDQEEAKKKEQQKRIPQKKSLRESNSNKLAPKVGLEDSIEKVTEQSLSDSGTQYVVAGKHAMQSSTSRSETAQTFLRSHFYGKRLERSASGGFLLSKKRSRYRAAKVFCPKRTSKF